MGRARQFDRDAAVEWVMNEIWRTGFEACSAKAISEKLGITRSSFYHTFGSREALFLEALERYVKTSPDHILDQFTESRSPLKLLTMVFKEVCRVRAKDPEHRGCLAINGVSELVGVNDTLGQVLENAVYFSITRLEQLLSHSVSLGELPDNTDTHGLALALQSLLIGLNTLSKIIKSEDELWFTARTTLKALGLLAEN